MEAAYFNNSGAVQGVVVLTQEVRVNFFERYLNGFEIYSNIQLI
jgi:Cu/Zn superoxide dismutase